MKSLARLRLAARTLLEWDAPHNTPEYRLVCDDLVRLHPFATKLGLRKSSPHWVLDDWGGLLWYLSRTLESTKADYVPLPLVAFTVLDNYLTTAILDFTAVVVKRGGELSGPRQNSRLINALRYCVAHKAPEVRRIGYSAIISIALPFPEQTRRELARQAMDAAPLRIRILQIVIQVAYAWFVFLRRIIFASLFIGGLIAFMFFDTPLKAVLRAIMSFWESDLVVYVVLIVVLAFIALCLYFLSLRIYRSRLVVIGIQRITIRLKLLVARSLGAPRLEEEEVVSSFLSLLSNDPSYFAMLMTGKPSQLFLPLLIRRTSVIPQNLMRYALRSLRAVDLRVEVRHSVFRWLCGIDVDTDCV